MLPPNSSILAPGEGEKFVAGPFTIFTRVAGSQTGGAFELYELALGQATIDTAALAALQKKYDQELVSLK